VRNKENVENKKWGKKKGTLQSSKNSSWSTPSSNFSSSSYIKFDYSLHAPTRLEDLKHPTLGLLA
jgi:hypothetical protein